MGIQRWLGVLLIICFSLCAPLAASTGPDDRPLTDPQSVVSASNPAARPAPIDDLYYTRSVFGAAWSPDGQQIVFTSDMTGRSNLWKVRASGSISILRARASHQASKQLRASGDIREEGKEGVFSLDR